MEHIDTVFEEIAEKLGRAGTLSDRDARALWDSRDLVRIGMLADETRRRYRGDRVSYLRVWTIGAGEARDAVVPAAAGEVRVTGRVEEIRTHLDALSALVSRAGSTPVTAGDLEDLDLQSSQTTEVMHLVREMRAAGVAAVASAAVDTLEPADGVISRVLEGGLGVARLVVRQPDSSGPWAMLDRVHSVHRVAPGPLSFAPLARRQDVDQPTTGYWDVKVIALSRLMLDQQVSLQVDWALHGPKLAQVALLFGADDVDAVPAVPDASLGPRRSPVQEIERNIRDASLTPLERDGRFQPRQDRAGT